MNVVLTDHFEAFVREQIRSGRFNNRSEVVRHALRLFEEQSASPSDPFPPGSLDYLCTEEQAKLDLALWRGCTTKLSHD